MNDIIRQNFLRTKFWYEILVAARFGVVGITATAIHILTVYVVLSKTTLPTLLANGLAFLVAFSFSFTGNYIWTFQSPSSPQKAMFRFLAISLFAFIANTFILTTLLNIKWFLPFYATMVSAMIVPLITFSASRFWGFK